MPTLITFDIFIVAAVPKWAMIFQHTDAFWVSELIHCPFECISWRLRTHSSTRTHKRTRTHAHAHAHKLTQEFVCHMLNPWIYGIHRVKCFLSKQMGTRSSQVKDIILPNSFVSFYRAGLKVGASEVRLTAAGSNRALCLISLKWLLSVVIFVLDNFGYGAICLKENAICLWLSLVDSITLIFEVAANVRPLYTVWMRSCEMFVARIDY